MRRINLLGSGVFAAASIGLSLACSTSQPASNNAAPAPTPSSPASTANAGPPPAAAASPASQSPEDRVPRISAEELKKLVAANQVLIIDVRAPETYQAEHIKGAISLPEAKVEAGEYQDLPRHKRIVTYCS
jgi:hypothetical protein